MAYNTTTLLCCIIFIIIKQVQPGHTIVLVSPLTLVNLLPYDLHYEVKATGNVGRVKPGEDDCLHSVDPAQSISLALWTDTLEPCGEITLNPSTSMYVLPFKLQDSLKRILYIHLKVKPQFGGALKVCFELSVLNIGNLNLNTYEDKKTNKHTSTHRNITTSNTNTDNTNTSNTNTKHMCTHNMLIHTCTHMHAH